mmetsp:Transcript_16630/g.46960  ORF Transcript_16630/g.46960 Transcript_16630/m.46960 type:complete len:251 (-) Transcript_16630:847-1599(-)
MEKRRPGMKGRVGRIGAWTTTVRSEKISGAIAIVSGVRSGAVTAEIGTETVGAGVITESETMSITIEIETEAGMEVAVTVLGTTGAGGAIGETTMTIETEVAARGIALGSLTLLPLAPVVATMMTVRRLGRTVVEGGLLLPMMERLRKSVAENGRCGKSTKICGRYLQLNFLPRRRTKSLSSSLSKRAKYTTSVSFGTSTRADPKGWPTWSTVTRSMCRSRSPCQAWSSNGTAFLCRHPKQSGIEFQNRW